MNHKEVVTAWSDFILHTELEKQRLNPSEIHSDQNVSVTKETIYEEDGKVFLSLSRKSIAQIRRLLNKDEEGASSTNDNVSLVFPIISVTQFNRGKSEVFDYPLFKCSVPNHFFDCDEPKQLQLPVLVGDDVSILKGTFSQLLNINIDEYGENSSLAELISSLTEKNYPSFLDAYRDFYTWIKNKLSESNREAVRQNKYGGVLICKEELKGSTNKLEDFDYIVKRDNLSDYPLFDEYISTIAMAAETLEPRKEQSALGLFEKKHCLARGQMAALLCSNSSNLCAVQGPPGTGKSTFFKSLIANKITDKAFSLIEGRKENYGVVIASTAAKAVDEVLDNFRDDSVTQNIDWLYFMGGNKAKIEAEAVRITRLINYWQNTEYDEKEHLKVAQEMSLIRKKVEGFHRDYLSLLNDLSNKLKSLGCRIENKPASDDVLKQVFAQIRDQFFGLCPEVDKSNGISLTKSIETEIRAAQSRLAEIKSCKNKYLEAKERLKSIVALWPSSQNETQVLEWFYSSIKTPLEKIYSSYPKHKLGRVWARLFPQGFKKRTNKVLSAYGHEAELLGISSLKPYIFALMFDESERITKSSEYFNTIDVVRRYSTDTDAQLSTIQKLIDQLQYVEKLNGYLNEALVLNQRLKTQFPEGDWIEVLRLKFIEDNRQLYELAIKYIALEQVRKKDELTEVLQEWRGMLLKGNCKNAKRRDKKELKDFYLSLTLCYPVMGTTIASLHKLPGYKRLSSLKGIKPWSSALCDEAGMISVESMLPILTRAERTVTVGDPLQLVPIRTLSEHATHQLRDKHFQDDEQYQRLSPSLVTAYHRAAGSRTGQVGDIGKGIVLNEHRRCQKTIANLFVEIAGYKNLTVETEEPQERLKHSFDKMGANHLMFYSIEGRSGTAKNTNMDEVEAIGSLLDKLEKSGYDLTSDVAIISPYKNQSNLLASRYAKRLKSEQENIKIGTVHKFQGAGFNVVIYSPVIFLPSHSANWQNATPNMLNVAISRAKQQFIVVGNRHRLIKAGGYLEKMTRIMCDNFLLEHGTKHDLFDEAKKRATVTRYIQNLEHIPAFSDYFSTAKESVTIITPWIRYGSFNNTTSPQLGIIEKAVERGIKVKIYYGYYSNRLNKDDGSDLELLNSYIALLNEENVIRLNDGTHEKVIIVDGNRICLGSWNWLSNGYYSLVESNAKKEPLLFIRRETSVELLDREFIKQYLNALK